MVTKPSIDKLTEIAGNKYILCRAISKRAKELNIKQTEDELATNVKTISYAAQELYDGKIQIVNDLESDYTLNTRPVTLLVQEDLDKADEEM